MTKKENNVNTLQPFNDKDEKKLLEEFLRQYTDNNYKSKYPQYQQKYMAEIQRVKNKEVSSLEVHLEDLEDFLLGKGLKGKSLYKMISNNTRRYLNIISSIANSITEIKRTTPLTQEEDFDMALEQCRLENMQEISKQKKQMKNEDLKKLSNILRTNFQVILTRGPNAKKKLTKLRDLQARDVGKVITVKGIVTKVSETQPQMKVATYICETCQGEIHQKVNGENFQPPQECKTQKCQENKVKGDIIQNFAMSQFEAFQEIKIQENSQDTPVGQIPRTYTVYLTQNNTRSCTPGDQIELTGIYLTKQPKNSFLMVDRQIQQTYIQALKVEQLKKSYDKFELNVQNIKELQKEAKNKNFIKKLVSSIAPEIFGHEDVKKALLLQMVGGSTIEMEDGMKIRGDMNMALIGDPGVAKSQLLKFISHITPRGVYTTGKGSSGAGLTAAITRDDSTGQITLEGGALVLADKGICCIDEFDKMEEQDRVAIHEVMEQQTVSIAKSGITTRLNARTSILAAANPVHGRYNQNKSPHENVNLPFSLLSRFDLMFILMDKSDITLDEQLAQHITMIHQNQNITRENDSIFLPAKLKAFISLAKTYNPQIDVKLHQYICDKYIEKRQKNKDNEKSKEYKYITPRTLLSIIRLSQAMAKLRLEKEVQQEDIEEAIRLMEMSQASGLNEQESSHFSKMKKQRDNPVQQIFSKMTKLWKSDKNLFSKYSEMETKLMSLGFTIPNIQVAITSYQKEGLLVYDKTVIDYKHQEKIKKQKQVRDQIEKEEQKQKQLEKEQKKEQKQNNEGIKKVESTEAFSGFETNK